MRSWEWMQQALDLVGRGVIAIDALGTIQVYNRRAMALFGIDPRAGPGHPPGRLQAGDVVLLADNLLGGDDGGLTAAHLAAIGVDPAQVVPGGTTVVIGRYPSPPGSACFRSGPAHVDLTVASFAGTVWVRVSAHARDRVLQVRVGDATYSFSYDRCAGHLVLLDGQDYRVKFYQARGYTARGESAREILEGKEYAAKGQGAPLPRLHGIPITQIHPDSAEIADLLRVARGEQTGQGDVVRTLNGIPVRMRVVPVTRRGAVTGAVLTVEDLEELETARRDDERALKSLRSLVTGEAAPSGAQLGLVRLAGISREIEEVRTLAERAAETDLSVLLLGETGTGKGLLARVIHEASRRRDKPFVHVNCAAIPATLLESELFGYEEGSFTGARRGGMKGKFEQAQGGTIFLDEIADLDASLQAKVLHATDEGEVCRLGGSAPVRLDVRLIAATNRDLESLVAAGGFRQDLYWRLNVVCIRLPPLRERRCDIPVLVDQLLPEIARRAGCPSLSISEAAGEVLMHYSWPGNVRELRNVLEAAALLADDGVIGPGHLPARLRRGRDAEAEPVRVMQVAPLREVVARAERQLIAMALHSARGDRRRAMAMLGISRSSFYQKARACGLSTMVDASPPPGPETWTEVQDAARPQGGSARGFGVSAAESSGTFLA
ncbi:MAG: sigma 54-interacting transcriptional regulator [Bacillota bacterium]|nr:sigma 54-interacting transcriptional regulator [Bacillota bacterium]